LRFVRIATLKVLPVPQVASAAEEVDLEEALEVVVASAVLLAEALLVVVVLGEDMVEDVAASAAATVVLLLEVLPLVATITLPQPRLPIRSQTTLLPEASARKLSTYAT